MGQKERGAPSALSPAFCLEPELTLVHLHCRDSSFIEMQIPFQLPAHVCILRIAYSSTGMWWFKSSKSKRNMATDKGKKCKREGAETLPKCGVRSLKLSRHFSFSHVAKVMLYWKKTIIIGKTLAIPLLCLKQHLLFVWVHLVRGKVFGADLCGCVTWKRYLCTTEKGAFAQCVCFAYVNQCVTRR